MPAQPWTGIPPHPAAFTQLDPDQTTVLAYILWCYSARHDVLLDAVAQLPGHDGQPLGRRTAAETLDGLTRLGVVSVFGTRNTAAPARPLSVRVGGWKPRSEIPHTNSAPPRTGHREQRPAPGTPMCRTEIFAEGRKLKTVPGRTPQSVHDEITAIKAEFTSLESGDISGEEHSRRRIRLTKRRIRLYKEWAKHEPGRKDIKEAIARKEEVLSVLEKQLENTIRKTAAATPTT